ncbi:GTPase-associated protein 1-related protein [Micromonospora sp. CPCC 205711]|uniref:GTPase-associated protein 1-related protein n=1 Tax=Micromonospora sp. CPCC 205547 TaxID=3122400 RepID=UPI002FF2508F
MSGHFETLIYTDCRPGQGLNGSAGLQFQARSADSAAAAETLVRDHLLYEPPSRWMADRRPVEQYPPSFAHISSGGVLATAAGLYLGREANGTREGNQLTHAIVTTDPASYADLRPAQLFQAGFWSTAPAPTTRSDPVLLGDAVAGSHSPTHAQAFVLDQPHGRETLLALVCALADAGRPGRPRVLFVGDDIASIVGWLVAGTLLLPRERALELGFKIFSADPARSALPVVAVLPEFAGPAGRIDNALGYAVFDLHRHRHTPMEPTASARRWVDLFLTEDPRDVVDALGVATASGLAGDGGAAEEEAAAALGLAAILHRLPEPRHAEAIVGWLRTGPEGMRRAYGADVADLFAETPERWPQRVLVLLDEVGCDGLLPGKAADVRLALIIGELEDARVRGAVTDRRLPPLPAGEWHPDHDDQARQLLTEALTSGVAPQRFEALLRVATRFDVDVQWSDIAGAAEDFVGYWADHPRDVRPAGLACGDELDERLLAVLADRARLGATKRAEVGDGWWRSLLRRVETLASPLAEAVLGAAVRHRDERNAVIGRFLTANEDPDRFSWLAGALWSQSAPTTAELELVLALAPAGARLPGQVFRKVADEVTGGAAPDPRVFDLCHRLVARGLMTPTARIAAELAEDEKLTDAVAALRRNPDERGKAVLLKRLRDCPARLVEMRQAEVVVALSGVVAFLNLDGVLDRHPSLMPPFVDRLVDALTTEDGEAPAVLAYYLVSGSGPPAAQQVKRLEQALGQWLTRSPDGQLERADQHFARLDRAWRKGWQRYADNYSGRRRRYRLAHPFRDR